MSPAFRRGDDVSSETEVAIDREVKSILLDAQERARKVVGEHRDDMDNLAKVLLDKESLDRKDLDSYFGGSDDSESDEDEERPETLELPKDTRPPVKIRPQ